LGTEVPDPDEHHRPEVDDAVKKEPALSHPDR
jgi:hypothetical protein